MSVFRTTKYSSLPDAEKTDTVRLTEECLANLDNMEPTNKDFREWEANFNVDASVLPDDVFRELFRLRDDTID